MKKGIAALLLGLLVFGFSGTAAATSFSIGENPDATIDFGVRFRNFSSGGGGEVYLGVPDLGDGGNRNEMNLNWLEQNEFSIFYDGNNRVETTVNGQTLSYDLPAVPSMLNYLQLSVVNRDDDTSVSLDFMGETFSGTGWNKWNAVIPGLAGGFSEDGTLALGGTFGNSQELSKVEINFGHVESAPVPEPGTVFLLGGGIVGLVVYRRRSKK